VVYAVSSVRGKLPQGNDDTWWTFNEECFASKNGVSPVAAATEYALIKAFGNPFDSAQLKRDLRHIGSSYLVRSFYQTSDPSVGRLDLVENVVTAVAISNEDGTERFRRAQLPVADPQFSYGSFELARAVGSFDQSAR
jgi:hypothetical protein